jgi:branched-chain amino acid transport system permease protein
MSATDQAGATLAPAASTLLGEPDLPEREARGRIGSTLVRHLAVAVVLLALGVGLTYLLSGFRNFELASFMVYVIAAAGLTILIGLNGQISLGHGAIMAVGGYTAGFTQNFLAEQFATPPAPGATGFDAVETVQSWTIVIAIAAGGLAATVIGLVIGLAAARLRGPYLAGATLALVAVVPALTTSFDVFNGGQGIRVRVPSTFAGQDAAVTSDQWRAWVAMGLVGIVMVLLANLVRSRIGREFRAVRDDEVAAQVSGIRVARTQVTAFVISAAAAGLAGGLLVVLTGNAQPGAFGLNLSLFLVFAVVIGGLGSLLGAVWGSVFLVVVVPVLTALVVNNVAGTPALAQRLTSGLTATVFGLALIVVTLALPGGIQSQLRRLGGWLRGSIRRHAA